MSTVKNLNPDNFLLAINTALSSSYVSLEDAWLAFLQDALTSSSEDVTQLELEWLESLTSLGSASIEDQWFYYMKTTKSSSSLSIPDMLEERLIAGDLFT